MQVRLINRADVDAWHPGTNGGVGHKGFKYPSLADACAAGARREAESLGLKVPTDERFSMTWEVLVRDEMYARVYWAPGTQWVVVIDSYTEDFV